MAERRRLIEEAKIRFGDPAGLVKAYSKSQRQQGKGSVDRLSVRLPSVTRTVTRPSEYNFAPGFGLKRVQETVSRSGTIDKSGNISITTGSGNRNPRLGFLSTSTDSDYRATRSTRKAKFSDIFGESNFIPNSAVSSNPGLSTKNTQLFEVLTGRSGGNFLRNFEREVQSIDNILAGQSSPDVERKKTKGLPLLEGRRFFQSLNDLRTLSRRTTL